MPPEILPIHDPLIQPILSSVHNQEFNPTREELDEIQKRMHRDSFRFYGKCGDPAWQLTSEEYNPLAYLKQIREEKAKKEGAL
jgi:hypothetical protein